MLQAVQFAHHPCCLLLRAYRGIKGGEMACTYVAGYLDTGTHVRLIDDIVMRVNRFTPYWLCVSAYYYMYVHYYYTYTCMSSVYPLLEW